MINVRYQWKHLYKYKEDALILLFISIEGILLVFPVWHWVYVLYACATAVYSIHLQKK